MIVVCNYQKCLLIIEYYDAMLTRTRSVRAMKSGALECACLFRALDSGCFLMLVYRFEISI